MGQLGDIILKRMQDAAMEVPGAANSEAGMNRAQRRARAANKGHAGSNRKSGKRKCLK